MKRTFPRLALCSALMLGAVSLRAQTGRAGGLMLREPFGARPFSLGQAYSALGDDIYGMPYNPAILSRLNESQFSTQFIQSIADVQLGHMALATPLNPGRILAVSAAYLDAGKADVFDAAGNPTSQVNAQNDLTVQLTYAHALALPGGTMRLGASAKALRSVVFSQANSLSYAGDLGALYETPLGAGTASAALVLANFGPPIRYHGTSAGGSDSDPLPLTTRLGLAYTVNIRTDSLGLGAQLDRVYFDDTLTQSVGLEYTYSGLASLRLGYRVNQAGANLSMGFGIRLRNLSVDYGIGLVQAFDSVQQVSLNYRFAIPGVVYKESQRPPSEEVLIGKAAQAVSGRRYFNAATAISDLRSAFPNSMEAPRLEAQIEREINVILDAGSDHPLYHYAHGFKLYREGAWRMAASELQSALLKEPDNEEIQRYADDAARNAERSRR